MKPFFTAEDITNISREFKGITEWIPPEEIVLKAAVYFNNKLEREGKVVYGRNLNSAAIWDQAMFKWKTHKALLINVEKIE